MARENSPNVGLPKRSNRLVLFLLIRWAFSQWTICLARWSRFDGSRLNTTQIEIQPHSKLSEAHGKAKVSFEAEGVVVTFSYVYQDKDPEKKTTTSAFLNLKETWLAKLVNKGYLSPDDIIIAYVIFRGSLYWYWIYLCSVVGPTGSGKSTVRSFEVYSQGGYFDIGNDSS